MPDGQRLRAILVVDDDQECMSLLELTLAPVPASQVWCARSAEDALGILNSRTVSGVITDLQLPGMTGLEFIARLREQPAGSNVPILVVSANPDPAAPRDALRAGASAFFAKPFSPAAVRKKMEELIHAASPPGTSPAGN